jgi:non-specific serine/threonine protein kinase
MQGQPGMIGTTVSHYTILEKLGGGGMGVVYKAQDLKLDRFVVLKFLPPDLTRDTEAKQRFVHEAKAASALQHTNICVVHDIDETAEGQMFICMEYLEGETLKKKIERGPLKISETIEFAIQIAQGLAKAHEHGIIHRDIKPANVMVTSDGAAKIVDFGLAKLSGQTMLTKEGSTLGTAAYMSPEQARGEPADQRTDIWSLGVLLYEMLSGRRPFDADYENALFYSIINAEPEPITGLRTGVPMELERIVDKAMAKRPEERFQHVDEMLVDLRRVTKGSGSRAGLPSPDSRQGTLRSPWWKRPVPVLLGVLFVIVLIVTAVWFARMRYAEGLPARERTIAVLPLNALSKTEEDQMFADGIHGEILTHLTRIKDIKVKAQTSVLQYRDTRKTMREIGQELGVNYLIEGSVQKAGGRIRIQTQLIDAQSEDHIWAHSYEKPYGDIFAIQTEISEQIASELKATMTPREKSLIGLKLTENTEAYDCYLMGNRIWRISQTLEEDIRAVGLLEKAVALDPNFAVAWAKLCVVRCEQMFYEHVRSVERMAQAKVALQKAEALEPDIPEVHQAKGIYYFYVELDSTRAFTEFQLALADQPNNSEFLSTMGTLLAAKGYEPGGLENNLKAYELDPDAVLANFVTGGYFCMRQFADAERMSDVQIALEPGKGSSYVYKFYIYLWGRGDLPRAREVLEEARRQTQQKLTGWGIAVHLYAREYAAALAISIVDSSTDPLVKADIYRFMREHAKANDQALVAVAQYSKVVDTQPDWEYNHLVLARAFAILGKRDSALFEISKILHRGLKFSNNLGRFLDIGVLQVHVLLGNYEEAIIEIEQLLSTPSSLTEVTLRLDPIYDPLRSNPRFQALVRSSATDEHR